MRSLRFESFCHDWVVEVEGHFGRIYNWGTLRWVLRRASRLGAQHGYNVIVSGHPWVPKAKARGGVTVLYPAGMSFNQQSVRMAIGLEDQPQVFRVRKAKVVSARPTLDLGSVTERVHQV